MSEMADPQQIPLDAWGAKRYGDHAPKVKTLRRWAREGRIFPKPEKHGRSYFVSEHARYIDFSDPDYLEKARLAVDGPAAAKRG